MSDIENLKKELHNLGLKYHNLLRKKDELERDAKKYVNDIKQVDNEIIEIKNQIDTKIKELLILMETKLKSKFKEENKMVEEEKQKEVKKSVKMNDNKPKLVDSILKVMQMKSIKNIEAAVEKLKTIHPDKEPIKLKNQLRNVINAIKKGKQKKLAIYNFNKEEFLVELK